MTPADYDAWYTTPRGAWILAREWRLVQGLLGLPAGSPVLDVGAGTGRFTALLESAGLAPVGAEPDAAMRAFAAARYAAIPWVGARAEALPFGDGAFAAAIAVTSLCFVADERRALTELVRVSRGPVVVGLLNRRSRLYRRKAGQGGYAGARWHTRAEARALAAEVCPHCRVRTRTAIRYPEGERRARLVERLRWSRLDGGGFLALALYPARRAGRTAWPSWLSG